MKYIYLILLIALLGGFNVNGQSYGFIDSNWKHGSIPSRLRMDDYDTLKVIMIVCDTVLVPFSIHATATISSSGQINNNGKFVYWQFGYEVINGPQIYLYHNDGSRSPLFKHIKYLTSDKTELPKNIIVWQTKKL